GLCQWPTVTEPPTGSAVVIVRPVACRADRQRPGGGRGRAENAAAAACAGHTVWRAARRTAGRGTAVAGRHRCAAVRRVPCLGAYPQVAGLDDNGAGRSRRAACATAA